MAKAGIIEPARVIRQLSNPQPRSPLPSYALTTSSGSVVKVGKILDKLKQHCPQCSAFVFAKRIVGKYVRDSNRILIWECPECEALWRKPQEAGEDE